MFCAAHRIRTQRPSEQPGEGFIFMALELQSKVSFSRRGKVAAMAECVAASSSWGRSLAGNLCNQGWKTENWAELRKPNDKLNTAWIQC